MSHNNIVIKNKKASFEYYLLDKYTAGIVLTGKKVVWKKRTVALMPEQ